MRRTTGGVPIYAPIFVSLLLSVVSLPTGAAPVCVKQHQNWQYATQKDEMRGTESMSASIAAQCLLALKPPYDGGSPAVLVVARTDKGYLVYLTVTPGQFKSGELVHAKFDDGPVVNLGAGHVSAGNPDTLVILGEDAIVDRLKTAKRLVLEVVLFGDGPQQIKFDVSGFDVAKLQGSSGEPNASPVAMSSICAERVKPEMPRQALRDGTTGEVVARATVVDGRVVNVEIISGPRVFHSAARDALMQYKCSPTGRQVLGIETLRFSQ